MSKWILCEATNCTISKPSVYGTYEEAYAEMEKRYNTFVTEASWVSSNEINNEYAYVQTDEDNLDLRIDEITI